MTAVQLSLCIALRLSVKPTHAKTQATKIREEIQSAVAVFALPAHSKLSHL